MGTRPLKITSLALAAFSDVHLYISIPYSPRRVVLSKSMRWDEVLHGVLIKGQGTRVYTNGYAHVYAQVYIPHVSTHGYACVHTHVCIHASACVHVDVYT